MVVFAVYSACVDPDRVLRALRPLAGRSALTATLVSRLVPVAAADAARLRDAAALRGPGAAAVGKAALARRLLAGSLDRAVDVAATLELRGYSLDGAARRARRRERSRYDRRFYLVGAVVLVAGDRRRGRSAPTTSTPTRRSRSGSARRPWRSAALLAGQRAGAAAAPVAAPGARRGAAAASATARPALGAGRV